ncbi:VCBS repeat-containing protein [Flavobacteriaceae bacterium]|nr:VCBS repeat-containing protein [Flavobacteriaceae bacterium]
MKYFFLIILSFILLLACNSESKKKEIAANNSIKTELEISDLNRKLISKINSENTEENFLQLVSNKNTGINFSNTIKETNFKNHKSYPQIYNGGGVAVGDLNNDGLPDIYFAGNQPKDKIYFNTGNFTFKDVTEESGIAKENYGWSFGVNMVDINADGFLDIYVCKAGPYNELKYLKNRLFINNGDGTFNEEAEKYGLNSTAYSVQSAFFDYDLDGDLDLYLANHPPTEKRNGKAKNLNKLADEIKKGILMTDNFYENIDGKFIEKTKAVNLSNFGYKNSIGVGDFNKDGFPDLYICSDYAQPDLLYMNNGNKTFTNKTEPNLKHITYFSMGNEVTDVNNDGKLDIYVTDMTPSDHIKSKVFMASMDSEKFNALVKVGFHHQYMLNTLQMNNGDATFSDIGQFAGIDKTDWSWAPLFFDIDLDGNKDLFITNGIKENLNDNDIKEKVYAIEKKINRQLSLDEYLEVVTSVITPNQIFKNEGTEHFKNVSENWIDNTDFNSNGAAYADLDGDGDLDLVLNNMDAPAAIFKNKSEEKSIGNSIVINLQGPDNNPFGIGTKISLPFKDKTIYHEHYPARGYLSSVGYKIVLGLGAAQKIPKMIVEWPDGKVSILKNLEVNKQYGISYNKTQKSIIEPLIASKILTEKKSPNEFGISYIHEEDKINDFKKQVLLPYSQSQNGPFIDKADLNNDGLTDFFVGGAAGQSGELYFQTKDGSFKKDENTIWNTDKGFEDLGVLFFDYDTDGDYDLYIASGSAAFDENNAKYQDRLYKNDGKGNFSNSNSLPKNNTSNQKVIANDFDNDGDLDLFVGGRVIPDKYPYAPKSQLLINDKGIFTDQTKELAPQLLEAGLITDAVFSDYDNDGDSDLIITAEWSPIKFYENKDGKFELASINSLNDTEGIWFSVEALDIDQDGDDDYLFGNLGLNSKFKATIEKPLHVFCDDFDDNGTYDIVFSKDYHGDLVPMRGRECSSEQMPFIAEKFENFISFAEASLEDIMGEDNLADALHYEVKNLSSICLINNGDGTFKKIQLPKEAQFSPIMNFTIADIDQDQSPEIIAIGNLYPTEVETTRYDASIGTILKYYDGKFEVLNNSKTGIIIHGDSKDSEIIEVNNNKVLVVTNNNGPLTLFQINN